MHPQRFEPQHTYKETSLLPRPNNNLFIFLFWRHTSFHVQKVELVCLYICRQLSVFPNNSVNIRPVKLKINTLYHMNNIPLCFDGQVSDLMFVKFWKVYWGIKQRYLFLSLGFGKKRSTKQMKVAEVSMVGIHSVLEVEKTVYWERE